MLYEIVKINVSLDKSKKNSNIKYQTKMHVNLHQTNNSFFIEN